MLPTWLVRAMVMAVVVAVVMGRALPDRSNNPLLIFSHILQGQDPAGAPRLFDDDFDDDDDDDDEGYFGGDVNPFSFFG
ncbi:hypothetical protein O3P69_016822 [Scylla paramamosain]|uniref:Secreted protein n=2 Tax=Scylla paramamosain TaxID=85552 RepID=A0AAW0SZX4_SCYPA